MRCPWKDGMIRSLRWLVGMRANDVVRCLVCLGYDVTRCFLLSCSDYLFKLLLIGDSGVGKSCLLLRFAVSIFFNILANSYSCVENGLEKLSFV
jgi:hypothetical protein